MLSYYESIIKENYLSVVEDFKGSFRYKRLSFLEKTALNVNLEIIEDSYLKDDKSLIYFTKYINGFMVDRFKDTWLEDVNFIGGNVFPKDSMNRFFLPALIEIGELKNIYLLPNIRKLQLEKLCDSTEDFNEEYYVEYK